MRFSFWRELPAQRGRWVLSRRDAHYVSACIRARMRGGIAGVARATAVFGEISDQPIHRRKVGAVMDKPALLARADETGVRELLQMERQRRGRHAEHLRDASRRKTLGATFDEQPEQRESRFLRKGGKRSDSDTQIHISNNIET